MPTVPRLTTRSEGFVELVMWNTVDVTAYRVSASNTLDGAFTAPNVMFTVPRGGTYKSRSLRRRGVGTSIYTIRGRTFAQYDPEDFWVGGGTYPHDTNTSYVVVEEQNAANVFRPAGPILVVPPSGFFNSTRPSLIVAGTAPNVAASSTGVPPAGAMCFVLPRIADSAVITNNGGASIFISCGAGMPEFEILDGATTFLPDGAISEVYVRGSGMAVTFSIIFAVVNAEMA